SHLCTTLLLFPTVRICSVFFFTDAGTTEIYTLSLHTLFRSGRRPQGSTRRASSPPLKANGTTRFAPNVRDDREPKRKSRPLGRLFLFLQRALHGHAILAFGDAMTPPPHATQGLYFMNCAPRYSDCVLRSPAKP